MRHKEIRTGERFQFGARIGPEPHGVVHGAFALGLEGLAAVGLHDHAVKMNKPA